MPVDLSTLRSLRPLDPGELARLPTRALLRRLSDLRALQDGAAASDWTEAERAAVAAAGLIAFKDSALWQAAFAEVKALLASREHVRRGGKAARQGAQQARQSR